MYNKIQIIALLSKFSSCEQSLGNNLFKSYSKGNFTISTLNLRRYFILKNILLNNQCLTNLDKELLDVLQDICNKCQILVPIDPNVLQGCDEFSILTEQGDCLSTEDNDFIIQE